MTWPRPRLATVLVMITLVIGLLPLGGIAVLRVYESALVRQTESELIAQGVVIAASYRAHFARLAATPAGRQRALKVPADYGNPVTSPPRPQSPAGHWQPRYAQLDLAADPILPPLGDPLPSAQPPDAAALAVGAELLPLLRDAQQITLAGFRLTDAAGTIVATTGDDLGRSVRHYEEVQRALTGEYVSLMRWRGTQSPAPPLESISRGTRIRVHVAVPIVLRDRVIGSVVLLRTPGNIWQALYGKRRELLGGGVLVLAALVAIALLTSFTIARPVRALREQARRAARGERGAVTPLPRPGTRELAELSETVAEMAATLEQRASYIRDFAAQVSHEFKTPLTAMQGAVEMLREHGATMSEAERERFLAIVDGDVKRLAQLVQRLLELARAEVAGPGTATADAAAVLARAAARQRERGLVVALAPAPGPLPVAMAPETLDAVLSSLLDNVRSHAGPEARVAVDATLRDGAVELQVRDDGAGISAANAAHVFEPFFTTARDRGGTGLGLSIARALLRAHGGGIELLPSARGAHFRLWLPQPRGGAPVPAS